MLDQIHDIDQVLAAGYHDIVMSPWHTQRRVFVGDAAHAMSPQLGQGTNLALLDASALAAALSEDLPLALALERYSRQRRAHISFYQFASRWLTPFFQSDVPGLTPLRNWGMRLACKLPFLEGQMLRTMSGIKRGILRPSLPLPLPALSSDRTREHDQVR